MHYMSMNAENVQIVDDNDDWVSGVCYQVPWARERASVKFYYIHGNRAIIDWRLR